MPPSLRTGMAAIFPDTSEFAVAGEARSAKPGELRSPAIATVTTCRQARQRGRVPGRARPAEARRLKPVRQSRNSSRRRSHSDVRHLDAAENQRQCRRLLPPTGGSEVRLARPFGAFAPRCPAPYARGRRAAATACQPTAPAGPGPCLQMRLPAGLPGSRGGRQASGRNSHVI
jgi:hypothetical protein